MNPVTRRSFLQSSAALAAANLASPAILKGGTTKRPPNVLIFMPDQQQGATVLPESPCLTPHLQRFAEQAVTFNSAYCPAPHCCPSRASFMTGLYPSEHGVFNNVDTDTAIHTNPYPGTKFFSERLKQAGYRLSYSGKWHVARNQPPQDHGWHNLNPPRPAYRPGGRLKSSFWARIQAHLHEPAKRNPGEVLRPGWGNVRLYGSYTPRGPRGYERTGDYEIVRRGVAGLKDLARGDQPWCLMVSNSGGHDRYVVPRNFAEMYRPESIELPPSFRDTLEDKPRIYQRMRYQYWAQMSDDEVRQCIAHYWAKLTMQDALFGLLLDALEQTGEAENTVVIYTSDHGDYAGAHGLWAKGVPSFHQGYNIPCMVRWPRGISHPGRTVDAFISTVDFAPTILDAAGTSPAAPMSGHSFLPWLRGDSVTSWPDAVYHQLNGVELYYTQRIVMTKKHKYVYNGFDYDELYDLQSDPYEMVNLAFPNVKPARTAMEEGRGLQDPHNVPWPMLTADQAAARHDLLVRMWRFAQEHKDQIFNSYLTVAMAPLGPAIAIPD